MQSYVPREVALFHSDLDANALKNLSTQREFFVGSTDAEVREKMDARAREVERNGLVAVHRTKIGRNATCPCGSGRKFKKCCLGLAR